MVSKVKVMFNKANEELKHQKELEYIDKITNLKNRKYLIDKLPQYLKVDAPYIGGINILIALNGVIEANEKIGHTNVDKLFIDISHIFKAHASNYKNSIVARVNGTEFAIFIPNCTKEEAIKLSEGIYTFVNESIQQYTLDTNITYISLGIYLYSYQDSIEKFLSNSDNALTQAKFNHNHISFVESKTALEVMGKDAWRNIIDKAIHTNNFHFISWNVINTQTRKVTHKVLSMTLIVDKQTSYSYTNLWHQLINYNLVIIYMIIY